MKEATEILQKNGGNMSKIEIKEEFKQIVFLPHMDCGSIELHEENKAENAVHEVKKDPSILLEVKKEPSILLEVKKEPSILLEVKKEPSIHTNPKEGKPASEYIKKLLEDWREDDDEEGEVVQSKKHNKIKESPVLHHDEKTNTLTTSVEHGIVEEWRNKKEDIKQEPMDENDSLSHDNSLQVGSTHLKVDQPTSVSSTDASNNLKNISVKNDKKCLNNQENHLPETTLQSSVITTNVGPSMKQKHISVETAHFSKISDDIIEEDSKFVTAAEDLCLGTCSCHHTASGSKKRKMNLYDMLVKIDKHLDKNEDEFDMIGRRIASRLRKLPQETGLVAEKLINDIMFECEKGNVNMNTKLNVHQISQQSSFGPSCSYSPVNVGQSKKISTQQETMYSLFSGKF